MSAQIKERVIEPVNGFAAFGFAVCLMIGGIGAGLYGLFAGSGFALLFAVVAVIVSVVLFSGIKIVSPNEAVVLQWFGSYYGTIYKNGIFFLNPLTSSSSHSLKRQNFASEKVRTNDKRGNPIDLSVIVAWQIGNATSAEFNVEGSLDNFIKEQVLGIFSEEAPKYYFDINDHSEENKKEIVFRRNGGEIAEKLKTLLNERVANVGIKILDLNFNHCAYAKEIAHSMLKKQQAEATMDARKTIVDGAHNMVVDLTKKFKNNKDITMTEEDISAMARNLMIVLVSDKDPTPTISLD